MALIHHIFWNQASGGCALPRKDLIHPTILKENSDEYGRMAEIAERNDEVAENKSARMGVVPSAHAKLSRSDQRDHALFLV